MTKYVLLTGPPGIGKTTIVQRICQRLVVQNVSVDGFYTQELRDSNNVRLGFDIITLDNKCSKLARRIDCVERKDITKYIVGQYIVYPDELQRIVVPIIQAEKTNLLILDEIGRMELFSTSFKESVQEIFKKGTRPILATIPLSKGRPNELIESLKRLDSTIVVHVNKANRDQLPIEIINNFNLS